MSYKTILVHIDDAKRCPVRLAPGTSLARTFGAHLVALYAESQFKIPGHAAALAGTAYVSSVAENRHASVTAAERAFRAHAQLNGDVQMEWRSTGTDPVSSVSLHARYADLNVIGQADAEDGSTLELDFPERLLLSAGRPLLIVPYAGDFTSTGERILICWSATRESTRAVTDALPLLQRASHVHAAAFNPTHGAHGQIPGADIGLFLARHGVNVEVSDYRVPDMDVGGQILSRAMDLASDLIVMGGHGHPRVHELILGGVSRTLLASMTVPVLMSH